MQSTLIALETNNHVGIDWRPVIAVCFGGAKEKVLNPNMTYVHRYGHFLNLIFVNLLGKISCSKFLW